jgi:polyhydroxyalkanoate synthase
MPFDDTSSALMMRKPISPFSALDRIIHGTLAEQTGGSSPVLAATAWMDWIAHLAMSPGKQIELWLEAGTALQRMGKRLNSDSASAGSQPGSRFNDPGWQKFPYDILHQSHRACSEWWHSATTDVRGVAASHQRLMQANVRQALKALSPANFLPTNPELQRITRERGGRNLVDGANNFVRDRTGGDPNPSSDYAVGKNLALSPGKVIFRNRLIELIQYTPTTQAVFPEPVLIIPAWIMKYYILDLQPQNSMIRFLVERGHTVFAISWRNPTAEDADLGMDDYRKLGVMAAIDTISECMPDRRIHATGYCLGGTMLSIVASLTLFAAQTDFSEPGDFKLFINDTTVLARRADGNAWRPGRHPDGRSLPDAPLRRVDLGALRSPLRDGRNRSPERPDVVERRPDPHAVSHALRIPQQSVPA